MCSRCKSLLRWADVSRQQSRARLANKGHDHHLLTAAGQQHCKNCSRVSRRNMEDAQCVKMASKFPRSQHNWATTGCSGKSLMIQGRGMDQAGLWSIKAWKQETGGVLWSLVPDPLSPVACEVEPPWIGLLPARLADIFLSWVLGKLEAKSTPWGLRPVFVVLQGALSRWGDSAIREGCCHDGSTWSATVSGPDSQRIISIYWKDGFFPSHYSVVPHNPFCTFIRAEVFNRYLNWSVSRADNVLISIISVKYVNVMKEISLYFSKTECFSFPRIHCRQHRSEIHCCFSGEHRLVSSWCSRKQDQNHCLASGHQRCRQSL